MKLKQLEDFEIMNYHILLNIYCNCEEYLNDKIIEYAQRYCDLNGVDDIENSFLMLSYPTGKNKEQERKLFFDSPAMLAENLEFEGVFAIYLPSNTNEDEMKELYKYVNDHKTKIHFVFITTLNNMNLLNQIHDELSNVVNIKIIDELETSSEELYELSNIENNKEYFMYLLKNTKLNLNEIKFRMIHEKQEIKKIKNKIMF